MAKAPLRDTLKHHWREVLIAAGLKVVETAPFYIFSTFVVSYATTTLSYQKSQALESVTLGRAGGHRDDPADGAAVRQGGSAKMYTLSVVLLGLFIVPWFLLLDTGTGWGIMLATIVAFGILWAPVTAVLGTLCSEIFSANVRYTGITLGYQLGAALAGGTAPLIATGLLAKYDGDWRPVAIYLGVTVAISLLAIFCASRMKSALGTAPLPGRKAPDRRPPVATTAPTIPPGGAALARASGGSRRGETAYPSPVSMGPVRRQPPPGTNRRQVFPLLSRPPRTGGCQALWLSS